MKFNASFLYRRPSAGKMFVEGGYCYIEQSTSEQLNDAEWVNELVLGYRMYVKETSRFSLQLGDIVSILMQDGQQFTCTITGVDFTVNKIYTFSISYVKGLVKANGRISYKEKIANGLDPATGFPVQAIASWSTPVECRYIKTEENLQAKNQDEPTLQVNYTIFVAGKAIPSEQIRLYNDDSNLLGEFSIISTEYLDTKEITKIAV